MIMKSRRRINTIPEKTKKRIRETLNKGEVNKRIGTLISMVLQSEWEDMDGYCPTDDTTRERRLNTNWCDKTDCTACKRLAKQRAKQEYIDRFIFK